MNRKFIWWICLLIFTLGEAAYASGINVDLGVGGSSGIGYDHVSATAGHELNILSRVQLVSGAITPPNPAGGFLTNQVTSFLVGDGASSAPGKFSKNFPAPTGAHFLRIWENGEPAAGKFYHSIYTPGSSLSEVLPIYYPLASFNTRYFTGPPLFPGVSASPSYSTDPGGALRPKLTINITHHVAPVPPTTANYETEVLEYKVQIYKGTPPASWSDVDTPTCKNYTVTPGGTYDGSLDVGYGTPPLPDPPGFYTLGSHYEIRVRGNNYFAHSGPTVDWGYASADTIGLGGKYYVYNLRVTNAFGRGNYEISWEASTGANTFEVWTAAGSPENTASYGSSPYATIRWAKIARVNTGDMMSFCRVIPQGTSLAEFPREVAGMLATRPVKGINSFPMPFRKAVFNGTNINTIWDLRNSINGTFPPNNVTAIGWFDKTRQRSMGYIFSYGPDTITTVGGAPSDPTSVLLGMDENYQVNLKQDVASELYLWGVR